MFEVGQRFPIYHGCAGLFLRFFSMLSFSLSLLACLRLFVIAECVVCFGCFTLFLVVYNILVSCFNWCLLVSTF